MDVVRVEGHRIAYRSAGDGPPLVFLHGFLCDSRCWRTQLEDLSSDFCVFAWDAPGAGASTDPPDPFTVTDWARCLASFLETLGVDRACIVGLSWGGMLAQELYRLHPGLATGLILCDTYAGWKGSLARDACKKRLERCMRDSSLPGAELAPRWAPEMFTEHAPRELVDEMAAVFRDFHPSGFRLMARSLSETDTTALLPTIDVPTLLLWGDDDRRSPMSVAQQFRDAVPNAGLTVIGGAGHVSNMEQPQAFNAAVRLFCATI